jgi:hypothetical protein
LIRFTCIVLRYKQSFIAVEALSKAESFITSAFKTGNRSVARPPLSRLSYDSHTLSRKNKKIHIKNSIARTEKDVYKNQTPGLYPIFMYKEGI